MSRRALCFLVAFPFIPFLVAKDKPSFPKFSIGIQYFALLHLNHGDPLPLALF